MPKHFIGWVYTACKLVENYLVMCYIYYRVLDLVEIYMIRYMEKKYKFCQSCGMPMKHDPEHGGTTASGAKSEKYCSFCYSNGLFTRPDFTAVQMRAFCIEKMVEMRYPRFIAKMLTLGIPKLERWRPLT